MFLVAETLTRAGNLVSFPSLPWNKSKASRSAVSDHHLCCHTMTIMSTIDRNWLRNCQLGPTSELELISPEDNHFSSHIIINIMVIKNPLVDARLSKLQFTSAVELIHSYERVWTSPRLCKSPQLLDEDLSDFTAYAVNCLFSQFVFPSLKCFHDKLKFWKPNWTLL